MDEFDFGSNQTIHKRCLPFSLCYTYNDENVVWMIATVFLIGSSSNLQITGTDIKSWARLFKVSLA